MRTRPSPTPEIGSVGLPEAAAREQGIDVAAGYVTFDQVAKAELIGETRGFIKYVVDRRIVVSSART
jgi:dihydrolipoyl dehydrogenase